MRLAVILALAVFLAACSGDRVKSSTNAPQVQPQMSLPT
jgi:PBP1b-binding outer membrane lipoprotein LpoB